MNCVLPWIDKDGSIGFNSKFMSFKYTPCYLMEWRKYHDIVEFQNYPNSLQECRDLNIDFFNKVKMYL